MHHSSYEAATIAALKVFCQLGVGMRSHSGIASTMFRALSEAGINIMISTSEIKIAVVIREEHLESAVRTLHHTFSLDQPITKKEK